MRDSPLALGQNHATYRKSLFAVLCSVYSHVLEVLLGNLKSGGLVVPPPVVVVHGGQAGVAEGGAIGDRVLFMQEKRDIVTKVC